MKTSKVVILAMLGGLFSVSAGGAATWWLLKSELKPQAGGQEEPKAVQVDTRAFRYVPLDKVIVMLRNTAGEPVSHYLALDLVFMSSVETEKVTREHLPLLRSVALKALSALTMETASRLTVDELTAQINAAYTQTYADDLAGKPFAEAMISKLIIE
jgi:flagellar FliL protein